jgi:hypothetical protein
MRTDRPFELLPVPKLFNEQTKLLQENVFEVLVKEKEFSENLDRVEYLKSSIYIISTL